MKITTKQLRNFVTEEVDYLDKREIILENGATTSQQVLAEGLIQNVKNALGEIEQAVSGLKLLFPQEDGPEWAMFKRNIGLGGDLSEFIVGAKNINELEVDLKIYLTEQRPDLLRAIQLFRDRLEVYFNLIPAVLMVRIINELLGNF